MVNLFVSLYIDLNPERQQELELCMSNNISNSSIDKIYLLIEEGTINNFKESKVKEIQVLRRPTFKDIFSIANLHTTGSDINIVINTDIYFLSQDIDFIKRAIKDNDFFALTRYDISKSGMSNSAIFVNQRDCQDAWIFKGIIRQEEMDCDFNQGKCGCDNRIAFEAEKAGYCVSNPSLTIKSYHIHSSQVRNYDRNNPTDIIPPPYLLVDPSEIKDLMPINNDVNELSEAQIKAMWE